MSSDESEKDNKKENNSNEYINPYLAMFPLNYPNFDIINDSSETKWAIGQNKERKLSHDKSLLGENSKIVYEARSKNNQNSTYVLGLLNKKRKNEISFYDIDSVFCLEQKVKMVEQRKRNKNFEEDDFEGGNKMDLMTNFGTAKAKKTAVNSLDNQVRESNTSSVKTIKNILRHNAEKESKLKNEQEQEKLQLEFFKEILPEFDLNERDVKNIFNFNTVIENEKVKEIDHKPLYNIIKDEDKKQLEKYKTEVCPFVSEYIDKIRDKILEGIKMPNKLKYLIYINELIIFYLLPKVIRTPPENLSSSSGISLPHLKHMLKKYTISSDQNLKTDGNSNKSKIIYSKNQNLILRNIFHILCLALQLESFEFDFTGLANSLKIEIKKLGSYFREIGGIISGPNKSYVRLTAPLKLNLKQKKGRKIR